MSSKTKQFYDFGPFKIDVKDRLVLRAGEVVALPPKAFELLLMLAESEGRLLSKEELMRSLWPDSYVEEANLSHNIYKLREALREKQDGQRYIETVPRRGYRFVAAVNAVIERQEEDRSTEPSTGSEIPAEAETSDPSTMGPDFMPGRTKPVEALKGGSAAVSNRKRFIRSIPITVGLLLILVITAYYWPRHAVPPVASINQIRSLAVLPFRPLSAESHNESLELGMADALITKLSNLKQVLVRPTSSVLKYASPGQDLLAAGREQGVDAIVEGQLQRAGDRIRFTVHLIRVSDGSSMWAGTFDDRFTNVFAVQDEISQEVAQALVSKLTDGEQQRISKHYTDNIEAYQLYQQGRVYWWKFTPDGLAKSIACFNKAIVLDPNYALAYAGLSFAYSASGAIGSMAPLDAFPRSKQAAETALKLDGNLAEAHVAVGGKYLFFERDLLNARKEFERAIDLNPNQPDAHELLAYYWEVVGQFDRADAEIKNAQRITPLLGLINMDIAGQAYYQHHYDEAIDLYNKAHELDPTFIPFPFVVGQAYERKGMYDQAIDECRKALTSSPDDPTILPTLGYAYASAGRKVDAQAILNKLLEARKHHFVSPFMIALVYAGLSQKDEAIDWLNKAWDEKDPQFIWFHLDPQLDSLHSDPRFTQLIERLRITQ